MIVVDISGHGSRGEQSDFLAELAAVMGAPVAYRHAGAWDVGDPQSGEELRDAVAELLRPVFAELAEGEQAAFIIPGYSPSVAAFLAIFHGYAGHFPRLIWIMRDDVGNWNRPVLLALDDIRAWSRRTTRFDGAGT